MLWEIQPPKWHSVCGRCTGFTELSENDDVSFPDCCCLYRCFFLFVGSSVDASILQGVARSGHLLQRCGCIIDGGFFRLMLQGQENKNLNDLISQCLDCLGIGQFSKLPSQKSSKKTPAEIMIAQTKSQIVANNMYIYRKTNVFKII